MRADEGRISDLFIESGYKTFGRIVEINDQVKVKITDNEIDEDLVNLAVIKALHSGANIFFFDKGKYNYGSIFGILRY